MGLISDRTIDEVSRVHVLDLAERMGHWTKPSGAYTTVYCPNPSHHEKTPDCKIKNSSGTFNCFGGGGCGARGGAIQYYSWATFGDWDAKKHFVDSVRGICEIMGINLLLENGEQGYVTGTSSTYVPKAAPTVIPAQEAKECDKVYRRFLELCPLYREHAQEWILKRKYSKEQILAIGLKSIPQNYDEKSLIIKTLIKEGYNLSRIPGFTRRLRKDGDPNNLSHWYWSMNVYGKYFIPVRNEHGYIVRLRMATGDENKKYTWFSSEPNVRPIYHEDTGDYITVEDINPYRKEEMPHNKMQWGGVSSGTQINCVVPSNVLANWEAGTDVEDIFAFDYIIVTEGEHSATR